MDAIANFSIAVGKERRAYIPVLRGLRPMAGAPTGYYDRTVADYPETHPGKLPRGHDGAKILTGETTFEELKKLRLGYKADRGKADAYDDFLTRELFDGAQAELVPKLLKDDGTPNDVVHLLIGGEERPIYSLGDGMQALIILTYFAFTAEGRMLFFIEEPDTHLHPGMQRKLLEVFLRHEQLRRHQLFLTTHSNHLLDIAADYDGCATHLFRSSGEGNTRKFQVRAVRRDDRTVLEALGVRASSVFLTNATIWVEGISDRLYLREYLRKFLEGHPAIWKEDTHYSFMECGGANVAHFDFDQASAVEELSRKVKVAKVCSESCLVLDGDNEEKGKGERVRTLKAELGEDLFVLKSKEIEHLLPVEILREYVAKVLKIKADEVGLAAADYQGSRNSLGAILDEKLKVERFADEATVKNKDALQEFAVELMRTRKDWQLTNEAAELCKNLVAFIERANRAAAKPPKPG